MSSLAESVCGICNTRRYKRDLRHVPLRKIPSIELLKIHPDLHSMIPKIQEINSLNSNAINKVWMGDIPKQLQGLTIPEQRLIALYRHNSCIVKLKSPFHSTSKAQSALKGNCISFPQDVINIATTLPLELDD
ncbi:unnamed protein product [Rotaria magnacalcarata]|uniref:DUF6570 domain-containing protein n=1 Tax=Rotaria magnacalcarata TaxID=392030 RepID=A0A8S3IGB8_9BILA|nr:unnamed protein product [Rotaria magnacalcarata]